jgi:hypothetical protein
VENSPKEKVIFSDEVYHILFPGIGDRAIHQIVRLFDMTGLLPCILVKTDFSSQNPLMPFLSSLAMYIPTRHKNS